MPVHLAGKVELTSARSLVRPLSRAVADLKPGEPRTKALGVKSLNVGSLQARGSVVLWQEAQRALLFFPLPTTALVPHRDCIHGFYGSKVRSISCMSSLFCCVVWTPLVAFPTCTGRDLVRTSRHPRRTFFLPSVVVNLQHFQARATKCRYGPNGSRTYAACVANSFTQMRDMRLGTPRVMLAGTSYTPGQ